MAFTLLCQQLGKAGPTHGVAVRGLCPGGKRRDFRQIGLGRKLTGSTELAKVFGTWERIFSGQAEWLARESRWPSAQARARQDHWRVIAGSQPRTHTLSPSHRQLDFCSLLERTVATLSRREMNVTGNRGYS